MQKKSFPFVSACALAATLVVACTPENRAPILPKPSDLTLIAEQVATIAVAAVDGDEGDTATVALKTGPAWAKLSGTTLTLSPKSADLGDASLTLLATDTQGLTATQTFTVTVLAALPGTPRLTALAPVTVAEGDKKLATLAGSDPDGDVLIYSLPGSPPSFATIMGATVDLAPDFSSEGSYRVLVRATDPAGLFAEQLLQVMVSGTDRAPTLADSAVVTVEEGAAAFLVPQANDPDGDPVTLTLGSIAPSWATLDESGRTVILTPGFSDDGSHAIPVKATANGKSVDQLFDVTVTNKNRPPLFALPAASVAMTGGEIKEVQLAATDPDGDNLTFGLSSPPAWISLNQTGFLKLAPPAVTTTEVTLDIVVSDGRGGTASDELLVRVARADTAGVVSVLKQYAGTSELAEGTGTIDEIRVEATVADAEDDASRLEVEVKATGTSFDGAGTVVSPETVANGTLAVSVPRLPVGSYHWRARSNQGGLTGNWEDFGTDDVAFKVLPRALFGTLTIDPPDYTSARLVTLFIDVTPAPGATLSTVALSRGGFSYDDERPYSAVIPLLLNESAGEFTVSAEVHDSLGNIGVVSQVIQYDPNPPRPTLSLLVGESPNPEYTTSSQLKLEATASDGTAGSGISEVCFSNEAYVFFAAHCFGSVNGRRDWTLSSGDGPKTVYVRAKDRAGNYGYSAQVIILDTTPPAVSFDFHGAAASTSQRTVNLNVDASDRSAIVQLCLSQDSQPFLAANCYDRRSQLSWSIQGSDGLHQVDLRALDGAGLTTTVSRSIRLDTAAPTISLSVAGTPVDGVLYKNQRPVTLNVTVGSDPTGIASVEYSNDLLTWTASGASSATREWNPSQEDGAKVVYARARDGAGNVSAEASTSFTIDTAPPVVVGKGLLINNDTAYVTNEIVPLSLVGLSDATSGLYRMEIYNSPQTAGTPEPFATARPNWTLVPEDGSKTVNARISDRAGNSIIVSDTILIDKTVPTVIGSIGPNPSKSSAVTLTYQAIIPAGGSSLADFCVSNDPGSLGWTCSPTITKPSGATAATASWTLVSGDGTKTVSFKARLSSGVETLQTATVLLDTTAPALKTVTLQGAPWTRNTSTLVTFTTQGPETTPITHYCISESTTACTGYAAIPPGGIQYALPSDGQRNLYLRLRDAAGNESAPSAPAAIGRDTVAPTFSFTINGGATITNDLNVQLLLSGATAGTGSPLVGHLDLTQTGMTIPSVYPYTDSAFSYPLIDADGSRTVFVVLADTAGNTMSVSRTIEVDRTPPTGTVSFAGAGVVTVNGTKYRANTAAFVALVTQGATKYCFTSVKPTSTAGCVDIAGSTFTANYPLTAGDGAKTVSVFFVDRALNFSTSAATDTITLDTTAPTVSGSLNLTPKHRQVEVKWSLPTDSGSGVYGSRVGYAYGPTAAPRFNADLAPTATADTLTGLSNRDVYVTLEVEDLVGNKTTSKNQAYPASPFSYVYRSPYPDSFNGVAPAGTALVAVGRFGVGARSTDSGATWSRVDLGADVDFNDVVFKDAFSGVAVGNSGYVSVTTNGGNTWEAYRVDTVNINDVAIVDGQYVAVGDRTKYWSFAPFPGSWKTCGLVLSANLVSYTPDESWLAQRVGVPELDLLSIDNGLTSRIVVVGTSLPSLLRSTDGGMTFATVTQVPLANPSQFGGFASLTRAPGTTTMYAATKAELLRSNDDGSTWSGAGSVNIGIRDIVAKSPTKIFILGSWGGVNPLIFELTKASPDTIDWHYPLGQSGSGYTFIGGVATATGIAVVGDAGTLVTGAGSPIVFTDRARNTPDNWTAVSTSRSYAWMVNAANRVALYHRPTVGGIATAGALDTFVSGTIPTSTITSLSAQSDDEAFAVGTSGGKARIYRLARGATAVSVTDAAGTTINSQSGSMNAIHCGAGFCLAAGTGGQLNSSANAAFVVGPTAPGVTYTGVFVYNESGTWKGLLTGYFDNAPTQGLLRTTTYSGGIVSSPQTVTFAATPKTLRGVARNGSTWIVVGDGGTALRSLNAGATWAAVSGAPSARDYTSVAYGGSSRWYIVGTAGVFLRSNDNGATFTPAATNVANTFAGVSSPGLLDTTSPTEAWAVGSRGAVLFTNTAGD